MILNEIKDSECKQRLSESEFSGNFFVWEEGTDRFDLNLPNCRIVKVGPIPESDISGIAATGCDNGNIEGFAGYKYPACVC